MKAKRQCRNVLNLGKPLKNKHSEKCSTACLRCCTTVLHTIFLPTVHHLSIFNQACCSCWPVLLTEIRKKKKIPKHHFNIYSFFIQVPLSLLGLHTFKICMLSAAGYISIAEQIWIINKSQFCAAWKRWLYQTMHFAPYNIHVCISKGNVVYEAHVIMLQLNCKDRNGKFTTEFHVTLYSIGHINCTLCCFIFISFWRHSDLS